jgi:hypothetical protein
MAARRFNFMVKERDRGMLAQDPTYSNAKARFANLLRYGDPSAYYGKKY